MQIPQSGKAIPALVGRELSAVVFVRDYVQLQFDGPILTTFTMPAVVTSTGRWAERDAGYRDALCSLIGQDVVRAFARPGDQLAVVFASGSSISVSLRPEHYLSAEAATLHEDGVTGRVWVW